MQHGHIVFISPLLFREKSTAQFIRMFQSRKYKMDQTLVRSSVVPAWSHKSYCFFSSDQTDRFVRGLSFTYLTAQCQLTVFKLQCTSHWFLTEKPREKRQASGYILIKPKVTNSTCENLLVKYMNNITTNLIITLCLDFIMINSHFQF